MKTSSLIFTLMICRNFFAHRNAVGKTRDGLVAKQPGPSNEYVTIAVVSQFKQLRSRPKLSFSGLQRDSNP